MLLIAIPIILLTPKQSWEKRKIKLKTKNLYQINDIGLVILYSKKLVILRLDKILYLTNY